MPEIISGQNFRDLISIELENRKPNRVEIQDLTSNSKRSVYLRSLKNMRR